MRGVFFHSCKRDDVMKTAKAQKMQTNSPLNRIPLQLNIETERNVITRRNTHGCPIFVFLRFGTCDLDIFAKSTWRYIGCDFTFTCSYTWTSLEHSVTASCMTVLTTKQYQSCKTKPGFSFYFGRIDEVILLSDFHIHYESQSHPWKNESSLVRQENWTLRNIRVRAPVAYISQFQLAGSFFRIIVLTVVCDASTGSNLLSFT